MSRLKWFSKGVGRCLERRIDGQTGKWRAAQIKGQAISQRNIQVEEQREWKRGKIGKGIDI